MSHIDPERLALFALGEPAITPQETEHLDECPDCVDEVAALRRAVAAGRASVEVGELETPPDAVWGRIAAELSLGGSTAAGVDAASPASPEVQRSSPAADAAMSGAAPSAPPVRARRRWRGWVLAASLVLVVGIGLGGWALVQRLQPAAVAIATLDAFPDHADARGSAVVEESADGSRQLRVELTAGETPDAFREVWLITADASALVSLGVLDAAEQTFPIPADVDLAQYSLVDVSAEPVDGDPAHSGDSIARGELSPT